MINIDVINETSVLTDDQVRPVIDAIQLQVHRDFSPIWKIDAILTYIPKGKKQDPTHWWMVILDHSDQAGALGYHDLTNTGLPIGKVFAQDDLQYGTSWSVTISHETLEMLADPSCNKLAQIVNGWCYALECCDSCEDDSYGYAINNILVSDFVTPAFFDQTSRTGPYDIKGYISRPFQILDGGYLSYFDGTKWNQVNGQSISKNLSRLYRARPKIGSRRDRRSHLNDLICSTVVL